MSKGTYGRLNVDFAGTRAEAREFAKKHGFSVGNKPGADEGIVQITAYYTNPDIRNRALQILKDEGWDREFVSDFSYTHR